MLFLIWLGLFYYYRRKSVQKDQMALCTFEVGSSSVVLRDCVLGGRVVILGCTACTILFLWMATCTRGRKDSGWGAGVMMLGLAPGIVN